MSARRQSSSGSNPLAGRLWAISRGAAWVGVVFGALPFALLSIAERRFGGRAPWSGLDQLEAHIGSGSMPRDFDGWTISLRDSLIAEVAVRCVVTIGWAAVVVVAVTTLREVAHLANDPRRWTAAGESVSPAGHRRVDGAPARAIALGVLALLPAPGAAFASRPHLAPVSWDVISDAGVATDRDGSLLRDSASRDPSAQDSFSRDSSSQDVSPQGDVDCDGAAAVDLGERDQRVTGGVNIDRCPEMHVVRAGESIYSIASDLVGRTAGPEVGASTSGDVARVAGLLLDLNLGRGMSDGDVFESPAHIEPGWVLRLPDHGSIVGSVSGPGPVISAGTGPVVAGPTTGSASGEALAVTTTVTVAKGDTLSGLVAEHLGPEADWREVYAWNAGREMGDGRTFDDPGLIIPGWVVNLDAPESESSGSSSPGPVAPVGEAGVDIEIMDTLEVDRSLDTSLIDLSGVDVPVVDVPVADVPDVSGLDLPAPDVSASEFSGPEQAADSSDDGSIARWLGATLVGAGLLAGLQARRRRRLRALPSRPLPVRVGQEVTVSVEHDSSVEHESSAEPGPAYSLERELIAGAARDIAPSLDAAVRSLVDLLLRNGLVTERTSRPIVAGAICSGIGLIEFAEEDAGSKGPRVDVELLDGHLNQHLGDPAQATEPEWEVESSSRLRSFGAPESVVGVFPVPLLIELGVRRATTRRIFVDPESVDALVVDDMDMARAVIASVLASPYADGIAVKLAMGGAALPQDSTQVSAQDSAQDAAEVAALSMLASAVSREIELDEGSSDGSSQESSEGLSEGAPDRSAPALARWHDRLVLGESAEGRVSIQLGDHSSGQGVTLRVTGRATTGVIAELDADGTLRFIRRPEDSGLGQVPDQSPDQCSGQFHERLPEPVLIDAHRLTTSQVVDIARGLGGRCGIDDARRDAMGDAPDDVSDGALGDAPDVVLGDALDDEPHEVTENAVASPDEAREVQVSSEWDARGALDGRDEPTHALDPSNHLGPSFIVRLFGDVRVESHGGAHLGSHVDSRVTTGDRISDVTFEKSKSVELLAWMVTHRERSTRAKARSAMWETRVAASTFANVVSDARRSLARAVPHDGGDWIERTMTEELRLARGIVSDAELMVEVRDLVAGREPGGDRNGQDPNGQDPNGQDPDDQHVEARLRYVLGLIRGMPFEGTAYLWPDPEGITSELVMLATGLATELAERCLARGDLDGVVWATGQGLRVLPGHEGLIALRLRARASTGDLAGVRQEWASYERVLADDWGGGEPAPELVALRRELLTR